MSIIADISSPVKPTTTTSSGAIYARPPFDVPIPTPPKAARQAAEQEPTHDYLLTEGTHDEGNARCVDARYAGKFLQNDAYGWLSYTGTHYTTTGAEAALDRAIVETLSARIAAALDSGKADKYADLIKKSIPSSGKVQGAKHLYSSLVFADAATFDTDPDLLNCPNGVVDLRTGKLIHHTPGQRFMHCAAVEYKAAAKNGAAYKEWERILLELVGSPDQVKWLKLAVGYSLTGHTSEEILVYLFGPPRAGKGLFIETIMTLLGSPLAKEADFATFTADRTGDTQSFDLAPLRSCRFIAASESRAYERFNEAMVKRVTGGNMVRCAFKHQNHFEYRPMYKIWLSSNQPVNADPDDDAVWGRIRVIEFPNSHLGREDKQLKARMRTKAMLEGVLAWAVEGASEWYSLGSAGLPELQSSAALKQKHRADLDNVQTWIDERCQPGEYTVTTTLFQSYAGWCRDNGTTPKQQKGFTQALRRKGCGSAVKKIGGHTSRVIEGLSLC